MKTSHNINENINDAAYRGINRNLRRTVFKDICAYLKQVNTVEASDILDAYQSIILSVLLNTGNGNS